ncbi:MAG: alpha/beta hydrolase [Desulfobacteraceae bacterium]|jgi:alpha/beta superfamily hydrolase|nr:MAG: alpha/beta hydrolase [Desulfobacteraceae bacterium]
MAEKPITITSGGHKIEALFSGLPGSRGVVVTHPHPLYGGDMYNGVVGSVIEAYTRKGVSSLRFNFQGVGKSEGSFDQGVDEQENVLSAIAYMRRSGKEQIDLVGYSFGAWVNALCAAKDPGIDRLVFISPPLAVMDFSFLKMTPFLSLVVTGSRDLYAPPQLIEKTLPSWNSEARLEIIDGADHFYQGTLNRLVRIMEVFAK